jgi:hypothetical protein
MSYTTRVNGWVFFYHQLNEKQNIPICWNISKILSKNEETEAKIDTSNTHVDNHSLSD